MARDVPEWVGADPGQAIPPRIRRKIYRAAAGTCAMHGGFAGKAEFDHRIALINGGENRESNIQLLCGPCHKLKTKADLAQKKKDNRVMSKHVGITGPKQKIASRGFPKRPPQRSASRPVHRATEFSDTPNGHQEAE